MPISLQKTRQAIVVGGEAIDPLVTLERVELFDEEGNPFSGGGSGEVGPVGPKGDKGDKGDTGAAGPSYGPKYFQLGAEDALEQANHSGFSTQDTENSMRRFKSYIYDNVIGHWIEWSVKLTAEHWKACVYLLGGPSTGKYQLSLDGSDVGSPIDTLSISNNTDWMDVIDLGIVAAGSHTIRITIAGPHNSSSGGDYIVFRNATLFVA